MSSKDGRSSACRDCGNALARQRAERVAADPERLSARRWHPAHPEYSQFRRERNYLARYGITADEYEAMYAERDGLCDICRQWFVKLCVDHCHRSGIVRGLLCTSCNLCIGRMNDDATRLRTAATYIERHQDDGSAKAA